MYIARDRQTEGKITILRIIVSVSREVVGPSCLLSGRAGGARGRGHLPYESHLKIWYSNKCKRQ